MEFFTTQQLYATGLGPHQIRREVTSGTLTRVRHGLYRRGEAPDAPREEHQLLATTWDGVLGFESAAVLHGLPLLKDPPALAQFLRPGTGRSNSRSGRVLRSAPLPDHHITDVEGRAVTTIPRTVVDVTRRGGVEAGLVPWEAARRRAMLAEELDEFDREASEVVELLVRRHGIEAARIARDVASSLSESPMETRSRWAMRQLGLPEPVQQFEVYSRDGEFLGRADFAWPELGVLGEYDGQDKYDRLARRGESPAQVVRREKRRQESMEQEGWIVVRWGIEEVIIPRKLQRILLAAFARARSQRHLLAPS
ncbi:type IV toxin-antitoxin system AbiEi family antitoxin domain-containing protein [Aestuariimicrobium sp. p3-SID1156]|uniref:type IV toxin-antitoxin system AbiEi family antitoxin domain-containing protein n=1 Tax=Aestuariimicrobium sp. p3-SID1156 TaxID=2916038 RepID=UPI00223BD125|nr:type IV toxin-antitoxin system AbiEi family antitoxin domain-containing protein [Aestuariimicrobium sp. p3-SID1156]MCT1458782.1 type IV toxin-antitoxin system AbiEi family antitoxin domain-containing protein [Aestuariimicrobium sp. p3-SID1156]